MLTPNEQQVFDKMFASKKKVFTVEDLAKGFYGSMKRPEHWEGYIQKIMRNLIIKTQNGLPVPGGKISVVRSSPLGRGNKAEYQLLQKSTRGHVRVSHSAPY